MLVGDRPFIAAVDVMGGSPGARETELLAPDKLVDGVDALSSRVARPLGSMPVPASWTACARMGRGFRVETATIPIVPAAILFDHANGGDKDWDENPYRALGERRLPLRARIFASARPAQASALYRQSQGRAGLGLDRPRQRLHRWRAGRRQPDRQRHRRRPRHFWAAPFEMDDEFGGLGPYSGPVPFADRPDQARDVIESAHLQYDHRHRRDRRDLTKAQAKRLAVAAQDGIGRAISPSHTLGRWRPSVFGLDRRKPVADPILDTMPSATPRRSASAAPSPAPYISRPQLQTTPSPPGKTNSAPDFRDFPATFRERRAVTIQAGNHSAPVQLATS